MNRLIDLKEVKVCWDSVSAYSNSELINNELLTFPPLLQERILKYPDNNERKLRILGKIMLRNILIDMGFEHLSSLEQIKFTEKNKPYFEMPFDFSIAHSGELAICAVAINYKIGVDIELIQPIEENNYHDYFSDLEIKKLSRGNKDLFFQLWTKKEALAKATGMGIFFPFKETNILEDSILFENENFIFQELSVGTEYIGTLCKSEN